MDKKVFDVKEEKHKFTNEAIQLLARIDRMLNKIGQPSASLIVGFLAQQTFDCRWTVTERGNSNGSD